MCPLTCLKTNSSLRFYYEAANISGFGGGGNDSYYGGGGGGAGGYGGMGGGGMGGGGMGGGGMGGGPGRFIVHMRGLPFKVTENDIAEVIHRDLQFFFIRLAVFYVANQSLFYPHNKDANFFCKLVQWGSDCRTI